MKNNIVMSFLWAFYKCPCVCVLTVPGSVPSQSLRATPFEDRILLYWKEPTEPNGIIIQYEVQQPEAEGTIIISTSITKLASEGYTVCIILVSALRPSTDPLQWGAFVWPLGASPAAGAYSVSALQRHPSPVLSAPPRRHLPAPHPRLHLQRVRHCDHAQRDY